MLIDFTIKNYRSIQRPCTLTTVANSQKKSEKELIRIDELSESLVPVSAIYGKNAAGKSNIIMALLVFSHMVMGDLKSVVSTPVDKLYFDPFLLDNRTKDEPTYFEIRLWNEEDSALYKYGFEYNEKEIVSEWLYVSKKFETKYTSRKIFERTHNEYSFGKHVPVKTRRLKDNVIPTKLAVHVFAELADQTAITFVKMVKKLTFGSGSTGDVTVSALVAYMKDEKALKWAMQFIRNSDLAIEDLQVHDVGPLEDEPNSLNIVLDTKVKATPVRKLQAITTHKKYKDGDTEEFQAFDLMTHESKGTQELITFLAIVYEKVTKGGVLIIDEFGVHMHPFLTAQLIRIFRDKNINRTGAQFIFATHDTYLLSNQVGLRNDEVWIAEKNANSETSFVSLTEYSLRSDIELQKYFQDGRIGGVPVTTWPFS